MSVPNHQIDPPDDEPCFECLVDEIGRQAAEEIREYEGHGFPLCRRHEASVSATTRE